MLERSRILDTLLAQHRDLRRMIARCERATGEARWDALDELRLALAAHQRCEERMLRPFSSSRCAEKMAVEHASERLALDTQDDAALAAAFAALRAQLDDEERFFLNERTLDVYSRTGCTVN